MNSANLIFIGSIYPSQLKTELMEMNAHVDFAAHTFQTSLLSGFDALNKDVRVITSPVILPYPATKKLLFPGYSFSHGSEINEKDRDIYVGSCSLLGIKMLVEFFKIRKALKRVLCDDNNVVFIYALHTPFLLAITKLN